MNINNVHGYYHGYRECVAYTIFNMWYEAVNVIRAYALISTRKSKEFLFSSVFIGFQFDSNEDGKIIYYFICFGRLHIHKIDSVCRFDFFFCFFLFLLLPYNNLHILHIGVTKKMWKNKWNTTAAVIKPSISWESIAYLLYHLNLMNK